MRKASIKFGFLLAFSVFAGFFSFQGGLNSLQALSVGIFMLSVMGSLFFWEFRLSFAFLGTALLLMSKAIDLDNFLRLTMLEVVLFLVGMMIIVSLLKDSGFFAWLVILILRVKRLTGRKFTLLIIVISALLACAVDEVTSIIFMVAAILEICDYYEVNPMPFVIISVLSTNIGSAATVLGNPIGIIIAAKAGLSFEDFIIKAMPLAFVALAVAAVVILQWFKKDIAEMDKHIKEFGANDILMRLISVPINRQLRISLFIFGMMLVFISLHRRLEVAMGLLPNTMLLIMPMITAGFIMIWKWQKAREYVEKGVEWWTLLFFMLLFAQAGTLKYTGATDVFAQHFLQLARQSYPVLLAAVLWTSSLGSSMLDNVIIVVTYAPMIHSFHALGFNAQALWWALLLGGCLGGNITLIGSTANIVAIGILEKEKHLKVRFSDWIGIGLCIGLLTTAVVWAMLAFLPLYRFP
ncbi:MAG: SLC13 family permease [Candidatus Omnitrophota bacterium]